MADEIVIDVKHGKDMHTVKVPVTATLNDLKSELARVTRVPVQLQRLTGKPAFAKEGAGAQTLVALGLKAGSGPSNKLMLVGSPAEQVQEAIAEQKDKAKSKAEFKQFPVPFWRLAPVAGLLADNFVEAKGQGLESANLHAALVVADLLLTRVNPAGVHAAGLLKQLGQAAELPPEMQASMHPLLRLSPRDAAALARAHLVVRRGAELAGKLFQVVKKEEVPAAVTEVITAIKNVGADDWAVVPFGFVGMKERASMLLLVRPVRDGVFRVVLVNRGVGAYEYHSSVVASEHKVKFLPTVDLGSVDANRILDPAWWLLALSQWMRSNDPNVVSEYCRVEVLYDVLLPWLLQQAPADTGVEQLAERVEGVHRRHATTASQSAAGASASGDSMVHPDAAHHATPIRSESSAIKGVFSAIAFILGAAGVPLQVCKAVKFAVRYEAMMRSAAELLLAARRWTSTSSAGAAVDPDSAAVAGPAAAGAPAAAASAPAATKTSLPAHCASKLRKATAGLEACGVNPADATINLDTVFSNLGSKDVLKNENGATLAPSFFQGKVVAVYFGGAWCAFCKQTTPLLKEAYDSLRQRFPRMFEVLYVSVDRNATEYSESVKAMEWPRLSYPPPEELIKGCDVSGVPKLLLFGPDGSLMTSDGVGALREDPDVELFPHAPWNGAKPLTDTDVRMLAIGVGHVAYHAMKRADAGVLNQERLIEIETSMSAVRAAARAMPRRPGGTNDIVFAPPTKKSAVDNDNQLSATGAESPTVQEAQSDALMQALRERCTSADTAFSGLELLRNQNIDGYLGRGFDTSLPALGNPGALAKRPTSLKELDTLLARAMTTVNFLWARAKHANTASRVAVQCTIMELITALFTVTIPVPTAIMDEPDFYASEGFLAKEERDTPPVPAPSGPTAAANAGASGAADGAALSDSGSPTVSSASPAMPGLPSGGPQGPPGMASLAALLQQRREGMPAAAGGGAAPPSSTQQQQRPPEFLPPGDDMQIDMLTRIYQLALSYCTAWQSVDVPTRAFDSEKCLTALSMLSVYDAIARNETNAKAGNTLAFLLNSGAYHLSTALCRNHRSAEDVLTTVEIIRPQLVVTRAAVIQYSRRMQERFPNEVFDFRMVDKFEVRKYSHTVQFMRSFMDACGYELTQRPQGGMMAMAP
jgi:thiol-disulfide isomerase/thioredoxin